jgi:hypothetical protein
MDLRTLAESAVGLMKDYEQVINLQRLDASLTLAYEQLASVAVFGVSQKDLPLF